MSAIGAIGAIDDDEEEEEEEEEEEKEWFGGIRASNARQHGKYISSEALTLLNNERRGLPRASLRPKTACACALERRIHWSAL